MTTIDLQNKKATKSTAGLITNFLFENKNNIDNGQKLFYLTVRGFIERQLAKPAAKRMTMAEILERSYNVDEYILATGAASVTNEFIKL